MPLQRWELLSIPHLALPRSSATRAYAAPAAILADPWYPGRPALALCCQPHRVFSETELSSLVVDDLPLYAPAACGSFPSRHAHASTYSSFQGPPAAPAQVVTPTLQYDWPLYEAHLPLSLALPASPAHLPYRNDSPYARFI